MTTVLIITTRRSMLIAITFKLTMLKTKTNVLRGVSYFRKHYTAILINRGENTLLGELLF